jgi:hypothetical protein
VRRAVLAAVLLALSAPNAVRAAWFGVQPIDGPNPAVVGLGGVDLARDGTGAIVYLRTDAGAPHVFLSRLLGGAWQPPVRLDGAVGAPATAAQVAAADGGVLLAAWVAGGIVYGMQIPRPDRLGAAVALGSGSTVDVDIGVDDAGWIVWGGSGDVHAASARDGAWSALPQPLDIDPARDAGGPAGPPRVAVGADGSGLLTWAETAPDGLAHVYARRLTPRMSIPPSDLTLPGGPAGQPDVDLEDDADFGWVVYRQDSGGTAHTVARRFAGSSFDPAVPLDAGAPSLAPSIEMSGDGRGEAVVAGADGSILWSPLARDAFGAAARIGQGAAPLGAVSQRADMAVVWLGRAATVNGRYGAAGGPFQPEAQLSSPALGAVAPGGYAVAADRVGDTAVAVAQGPDGARTVGAALWDRPPGRPVPRLVKGSAARGRPRLRWRSGLDLWGPQAFRVQVDGRRVGTTAATSLMPARRLGAGRHHWRVIAVDRRGQATASVRRVLRIGRRAHRRA